MTGDGSGSGRFRNEEWLSDQWSRLEFEAVSAHAGSVARTRTLRSPGKRDLQMTCESLGAEAARPPDVCLETSTDGAHWSSELLAVAGSPWWGIADGLPRGTLIRFARASSFDEKEANATFPWIEVRVS